VLVSEQGDMISAWVMADILIRGLKLSTKQRLRRRAERRGKSLSADLRETLERLAHEESANPDDGETFGTWLVSITRPGVDLDRVLAVLRSGPVDAAVVK
jgi:hypothetical protein